MIPKSRGRAGVAALVVSAVILVGSLWLAFGTGRSPGAEQPAGDVEPAPAGQREADEALADRADDLCSRLKEARAAGDSAVPAGAVLSEGAADVAVPEQPAGPTLASFTASVDGDAIVLRWEVAGEVKAREFTVERLGETGEAERDWRVKANRREFRDPVDALSGTRTYRLKVIAGDRKVADQGEREVAFRLRPDVTFLGPAPGGAGRFRVLLAGRPPVEFLTAPGAEIGEPAEGMDWRSGWRFVRLAGRGVETEGEREVPVFGPDGRLARDPESNEILTEKRVLAVTEWKAGALVLPADAPDAERWLPDSE